MTIGITGPEPKIPGRNAVVGLIVTAIIAAVCLILLGLIGDFLVDWMWFSSIGYSQVFWTTVAAKAAVFLVVFAATTAVLWDQRTARTRPCPAAAGFLTALA